MIYFDNAATTRKKPEEVYDAFNYYVREIGTSPGRGSYSLSIQASRMLYQSRKTVCEFFGATNPSNVVFTKNSTEAINFFFNGFLKKGDHVLISPFEHNAVLRPLHSLKEKGIIDYTILPETAFCSESIDLVDYIKDNTKLLAITFASNLTGQFVFSSNLSKKAKENGLIVFVDASQGAGKKLINMARDNIDFLAFTGHKDLLALPGVGGFVGLSDFKFEPFVQGGTGIHGESYTNPEAYPDSYEAGTLNMPAIWSLKNSIDYINLHLKDSCKKEKDLLYLFIEELSKIEKVVLYKQKAERVPTFCFNIEGKPSNEVVKYLSDNDICVRGGIHCAILAHETIGTVKTGAVRVSINAFNTKEEIYKFIDVIKEL